MKIISTLIIAIIFLSNIISQNSGEIEILSNMLECLENSNKLNKNIINEVRNYLINYNPFNIMKVYEFMQNNLNLVNNCTNDLASVPESIRRNIFPFDKKLKKLNWKNYLDCIQNHSKRDNSLDEIINFINGKNYYNASIEGIRLLEKGNIPAIQCENKKYENMSK